MKVRIPFIRPPQDRKQVKEIVVSDTYFECLKLGTRVMNLAFLFIPD